MNNNIIKSLRRTLLCTVAAAAVTIGFTACADEMFETQNVTAPANGNGYKINIAANIGSGDTRAVAYNSETGGYDATFETSDFIFVYNITKNANGQKKSEKGDWWENAYLTPDANGKKVNLVGELSFWAWDSESQASVEIVPEVGDELILYYKCGRSINYNYLYGEIIHDYALAKVTIESIDVNGVIKTSAATFAHPQSLYKIKFTGIASDINIKNVIIQSKYYKLVSEYNPYYVTSDGQQGFYEFFNQINYSYGQEGTKQHELIFSLRFSNNKNSEGPSGDEISFVALGSDGHYYKGAKSVTTDLENGKYYQAEVAMADAGKVMTLTNNKTEEVVVLDSYTRISSNEAPYTLENTGYDLEFSWFGGAESLTLKNISLNSRNSSIWVYSDEQDIENTKSHHLVLDGVNTMNCADVNYAPNAIVVRDNSSLHISAKSADGKLNMTNCGLGLNGNSVTTIESGEISVSDLSMWENSTLNIEGGVLTVNRWINGSGSSSCLISKDGKLRIAKNGYIPEGFIKAADGYVLVVSDDGEYWVFTAIKDDGSGQAQGILMMSSTATIGYNPSMNQYLDLRAYVYPEMTTDKSITWTTSDPNVVQIGYSYNNYANIYSTGVGTATVTATINGDTNLSAKCEITVKPFGGIWYENYEVSVTPESKPFINPITKVGKITSITYTSSDTSVATVNASTGEVTIKSGATTGQTVTITATATVEDDGEYIYWEDRKTASYTVKLAPATGQGEHEDYTPASW